MISQSPRPCQNSRFLFWSSNSRSGGITFFRFWDRYTFLDRFRSSGRARSSLDKIWSRNAFRWIHSCPTLRWRWDRMWSPARLIYVPVLFCIHEPNPRDWSKERKWNLISGLSVGIWFRPWLWILYIVKLSNRVRLYSPARYVFSLHSYRIAGRNHRCLLFIEKSQMMFSQTIDWIQKTTRSI